MNAPSPGGARFWNVPNLLTASRLLGIPFFIFSHIYSLQTLGLGIIIFALLSDYLDGKCARRLGQVTQFGSIFDPVADKIVSLFYLSFFWYLELLPGWYLVLVWLRDISQLMALPILLIWLKRPFKVEPKWFGKWGTAIALLVMVYCQVKLTFDFGASLDSKSLEMTVIISSIFEIAILVTYWPRFVQIAKGQHDTFE